MRHMPAAMLHGGGGVLLMMTTKFASQQTNKKSQSYKTNAIKALFVRTISDSKQQHKITSKNNNANKHPAPSNKLTVEMQLFQMRKMDQR